MSWPATSMRINGFLGDLVDLPQLMNEFSYNFALYGEPDRDAPWGWQLFGHHVALNCLVVEGRMVVSPVFLGAEPDESTPARTPGVTVFKDRIDLARQLMAALPDGRCGARPWSSSRWSTRPCPRAGCTPATNGTSPAASRTTA